LIRTIEGGEVAAVDAALAGRIPIVSITAAKQFLAKGNGAALRAFLAERGGRIGVAASRAKIRALQTHVTSLGRALSAADAAIVGSAVRAGVPLITRDQQVLNFLKAAALRGEPF
jgi:hypothetical protein